MLKQRGKDITFADADDARAVASASDSNAKPAGKGR
jgi:hypothetical protein